MKSITIHNLDDALQALITERAQAEGLSLNKTIKKLLSQALGLDPNDNGDPKADFTEFSSLWSKADCKQFEERTKEFRQVDAQDWQ